MALDMNNGFAELIEHVGHEIVCVTYGEPITSSDSRDLGTPQPANVALECETCSVVLIDFDRKDAA